MYGGVPAGAVARNVNVTESAHVTDAILTSVSNTNPAGLNGPSVRPLVPSAGQGTMVELMTGAIVALVVTEGGAAVVVVLFELVGVFRCAARRGLELEHAAVATSIDTITAVSRVFMRCDSSRRGASNPGPFDPTIRSRAPTPSRRISWLLSLTLTL